MNDLHNPSILDMFRAHKREHGAEVPFVCHADSGELAALMGALGLAEAEAVAKQSAVIGPAYYHGERVECVSALRLHERPGCVSAIVLCRLDGVLIAEGWSHEDGCRGDCSLCRPRG